jgi:hypothetical protein
MDIAHSPYLECLGGILFLLSALLYASLHLRNLRCIILIRWIRWCAISTAIGCILKLYSAPAAPFGLLFVTGLLGWFILESAVTWRQVRRLGSMDASIFFRYEDIGEGNLWPNSPDLRSARDPLERNGFSLEGLARVDLVGRLLFLCPIFLSHDRQIRLVMRFPMPMGAPIPPHLFFYSTTADGKILVTENFGGIFGGHYPSHWEVRRRPLQRNVGKILASHRRRAVGRSMAALESPPVAALNALQGDLLAENLRRSFVIQTSTAGAQTLRLGAEAGFRIWLEIWLLRYFGRPLH